MWEFSLVIFRILCELQFYFDNQIKGRNTMGCSESILEALPHQEVNQHTKKQTNTVIAMKGQIQVSFTKKVEITDFKEQKNCKKKKENNKQIASSNTKSDKENITKIKRAREIQTKPQHQKFISDIFSKCRRKLTPIEPLPQIEKQQTPKTIGQNRFVTKEHLKEFNQSQLQREISDLKKQNQIYRQLNNENIAGNLNINTQINQKQIERKINELRSQVIDPKHPKAKRIQNYEYFDSNKTLYL